jgi:large subunit ribosomal protein L9
MEVILLERVPNLGQMGDVVRVRDGYGRNFLLPQKKALRATKANKERFDRERVTLEARNLDRRKEAEAIGVKLDGVSVKMIRQSGDTGQLYGSVSARDIADGLAVVGFVIERHQITLLKPIKNLGIHKVKVLLHPEVEVSVSVNVARSMEEAERQAKGEDVLKRDDEADEEAVNPADLLEDPSALKADATADAAA